MAFNRELSQFANYLTLDASANYVGITTRISANVGIGSIQPKSKLSVTGDATVSGVTTSTGGFVGNLTGNVTGNVTGNADSATLATNAEGLTGTPNVTVNAVTAAHINSTGIITAGTFVGDGSGLTGVASTDNIQTATPANFLNNVNVTGVITATTFSGDGSGLVGILTATTFLVVGRSTNTNVPVSGNTFTIEGRSGNVIVPI